MLGALGYPVLWNDTLQLISVKCPWRWPCRQPLSFCSSCPTFIRKAGLSAKPAKTVWHFTDFLGQWESPTGTFALSSPSVEMAWQDSRAQNTKKHI